MWARRRRLDEEDELILELIVKPDELLNLELPDLFEGRDVNIAGMAVQLLWDEAKQHLSEEERVAWADSWEGQIDWDLVDAQQHYTVTYWNGG